jgi:ketosteroid isomerase-like protein
MRSSRFHLGLALLIAACAAAPDLAREREALLVADRTFDSTVAVGGLEAWVAAFSDSGRQVDRYGDFVVGPAAIRDHMRGLLTDTTRALRWSPDHAEVSADGTLGYTWGRWTMTVRNTLGSRQVSQGRYLTAWRKQANGQWKAEADVGTETEAR